MINYVPTRLHQIRGIASSLGLKGSLYEVVKAMKEKSLNPSKRVQTEMLSILEEENPDRLLSNIYCILHPEVSESDITDEDLKGVSLKDLSPSQLCNYFGLVFYGVSYVERDNRILLKYNNCIYNTGWFTFARKCRGIVLDAKTLEIIGYPFDKFFNINERPEYSEAVVAQKLAAASSVSLSEKKDGTLISVYRDGNGVGINTNGSLSNEYIDWARELFLEKYPWYPNHVQPGFTYVFELVIPETHCVINYGEERSLYLIAIRDMTANRFFSYDELATFARKNSLDITESEEFTSLNELVKKARELKDANKEGWVLKISDSRHDFFVKIKLSEYFVLHRLASSISLKRVYNLYVQNQLQDYLGKASDSVKTDATELVEEIEISREKYFEQVKARALKIAEEEGISIPARDNHELLVKLVKKLGGPSHEFLYIKNPEELRLTIRSLSFRGFQKMVEQTQ